MSDRKVTLLTGISGVGTKEFARKVQSLGKHNNYNFSILNTWDLLKFVYEKANLNKKKPEKILKWSQSEEVFTLKAAMDSIDEFCDKKDIPTETVLLRAHASFPDHYSTLLFNKALSSYALKNVNLKSVFNLQGPAQKLNPAQQWKYLSMDDLGSWTMREWEVTKNIAEDFNVPYYVFGNDISYKSNPKTFQQLMQVLENGENPIVAYFSYPVTKATDSNKVYREKIQRLKSEVRKKGMYIIDHEALGVFKENEINEWGRTKDFLRVGQLRFLLPQADVYLGAYLRKPTLNDPPEVAAGVERERHEADVNITMPTMLFTAAKYVSFYQNLTADIHTTSRKDFLEKVEYFAKHRTFQ